jgi:hypothetical protein
MSTLTQRKPLPEESKNSPNQGTKISRKVIQGGENRLFYEDRTVRMEIIRSIAIRIIKLL